jgi:hypothetical protein
MENYRSMEDLKKVVDKINDDKELTNIEQLIQDNKVEFEHKGNIYRVRLMSLREKQDLHEFRLSKYGEMLQDKNVLLNKDIIRLYKERDLIDIDKLRDDISKIDAELNTLQMDCGRALENKASESILNDYKDKINKLLTDKQLINFRIDDFLRLSLENQLLNYVAEYITYLTLDVQRDDKWERVFKTYEDFLNCEDEQLVTKAGTRSILLQYL